MNLFSRYYQKTMYIGAIISFLFTCVALIEVLRGNFSGFDPEIFVFGIFFGAFIWGDLLIFALLWFFLYLILARIKNSYYFFLAFYSFWLIRSIGETVYWFTQQFSQIVNPWPNYYPHILFLSSLTAKEIWVFHQLIWQSLCTAALIGLIHTIVNINRKN